MSNRNGLTSTPGLFASGDKNTNIYLPKSDTVVINNLDAQTVILDGQTLTATSSDLLLNGQPVGGNQQVGTLAQVLTQGTNANGQNMVNVGTISVATIAPPPAPAPQLISQGSTAFSDAIAMAGNNINNVGQIQGTTASFATVTAGQNGLTTPSITSGGGPITVTSPIVMSNNSITGASQIGATSVTASGAIAGASASFTGAVAAGSLSTASVSAPSGSPGIVFNSGIVATGQPIFGSAITVGTTSTINLNSANNTTITVGDDFDMGGKDIKNVNDLTMSGALATISNTAGTINMSAVGVSVNSLGSVSINAANGLGFSSSIEKFQMKDNTMSSTNSTDLTINDVDSIGNSNNNNVDMKGGAGNDLVLNSSTGISINPSASTIPFKMFNLPNTTSSQTGFQLGYNASTNQISYQANASAPTQLPFAITGTKTIPASPVYTFTEADLNKGFAVIQQTGANPPGTMTVNVPGTTTNSAFSNAYYVIFNAGADAGQQTSLIVTTAQAQTPPINITLKYGECVIIQYGWSPLYQGNTPLIIASNAPSVNTLSAVLENGNTTGAYDIVMGDGGVTKKNISNTGTIDVVNLQVNQIEPILPLISPNIGVAGNLVFDPDVPGSISNIASLSGASTNPIEIQSNLDLNEKQINNVESIAMEGTTTQIGGVGRISGAGPGSSIPGLQLRPVGGPIVLETAFAQPAITVTNNALTPNFIRTSVPIDMLGSYIQNVDSILSNETGTGTVKMEGTLDMRNNPITNCPTITAIESDITAIESDITALQTDKLDKADALYVNSYYVNDNVNDIQTVVNTIGADQGNVVYVGAGSYGGSTLTLSSFTNCAIMGPPVGGPSIIAELASGRGLTITSGSSRVRIANIQVEGLTTLGATGNNYFQSVQMVGGLTVANGATGNYFLYDCEITGAVTVPSTFGGVIGFIRCNFTGATFSLNNVSAQQVQFTQALGLVATYPLKAVYGGTNSLLTGAIFEGVNQIIPFASSTFSTTGCSTLGSTLTYDSGTGALALVSQSGATLSTVTVSGGGGGGGSNFFEYQAIVATQGPPIGDGHIEWNNVTQQNATIIYVSHLTSDGNDIDVFLTSVRENDTLIIQDRNNSANYQKWTVSGTPTQVPNDYYGFPVTLVESTVSFTGSQAIALIVLETRGVQSVSAGSGITVTGTALEPIVNADVVDIQAGTGISISEVAGTYTISATGGSVPTLEDVLLAGSSAGSTAINMNNNDINNVTELRVANISSSDGVTPINVNTNMELGSSAIYGASEITTDTLAGNTGGNWSSVNCASLGSELTWTEGTRTLELLSQTGAVLDSVVISAGSAGVQSVSAGSGTTVTGTATDPVVNADVVDIQAGTRISVNNVGGVFTINTSAGQVESVTGGTGISVSGTATDPVVNNDGVLELTAGTNITITGTKSNYTISASGGGGGSQNIEQVLTTGSDAGGLGINNLGDVFADSFQGQGSNANVVLGPGSGSITNVVSALLPISMDGARANIENIATLKGKTNAQLNLEAQLTNPLVLRTAGVEAMRITSGQNVGIGVTAPTDKLEVEGNVKIGLGYNFLGNVIGNLDGTANVASNLAGKSAHKLPYYNGTAVLSYANTTDAGYICSTDGNDVQFVAPSGLTVGKATNVAKTAGLIYNSATDTTASLSAGTEGQLVAWASGLPVNVDQSSLSVGSATTAGSATSATTASNIASVGAGVVYNSGANTTQLTSGLGTSGQVLRSNGSSAPSWEDQSALAVGTATNIAGGSLGQLVSQSGTGTTTFIAPGTANTVLMSNGTGVQPSYKVPIVYQNYNTNPSGGNFTYPATNFTSVTPASPVILATSATAVFTPGSTSGFFQVFYAPVFSAVNNVPGTFRFRTQISTDPTFPATAATIPIASSTPWVLTSESGNTSAQVWVQSAIGGLTANANYFIRVSLMNSTNTTAINMTSFGVFSIIFHKTGTIS